MSLRWARFRSRRLRRGTGKYEVVDDGDDVRLPLHNDDIFQHGITFPVKFIGYQEVPRPSSRLEIITSMRKIRYEYKMKRLKKQKVYVFISQEGVKTSRRLKTKRKRRMIRKTPQQQLMEATGPVIMEHTIFKVFYVSHDSQDLKIFSYIARDGPDNTFKCYVFKAKKKSQALRVVRTMGQAFEVVHKLQKQKESNNKDKEPVAETPPADKTPDEGEKVEEQKVETQKVEAGSIEGSVGSASIEDKTDARTTDEGLGGSDTFTETDKEGPTLSPVPSAFSVNGPIATSSPEPGQALAQQNQAMQNMINMLRKQMEKEMQARAEANQRNEVLLKQNQDLMMQMKQMRHEIDDLKLSTLSKVIGNTHNPIVPFVSTPGTPTLAHNNNNNVSLLDTPVPLAEDTLIPLQQARQNWVPFDEENAH